ncbi:LOW QUALITY PROTEIN: purine nucleoside phosphorylase 1 [Drosophila gunungcola]|uniref:LOW QUALITY PROTEIN: purine nucleoside phosphorylase 1 n=1 Tax=Drosophila gunungcola TaxID=103775 RepID=UPI0022E50003|nr:LOW QUALITY PROTEIN: purine nucleoside phosphorylase 1 [Drosophila gunungcola]
MCNIDCCSARSPIAKRMAARRLLQLEEEERRKPKLVIPTPQSLFYPYEEVEAMAQYIIETSHIRPKYGLICGSFLGSMISLVEQPVVIRFADIPNFPAGIEPNGSLVVGNVMGAPIIALVNRFHSCDGYNLATCSLPVRVMQLCGVKTIMLTSRAAAVNQQYALGDIMLIEDHINVVGMMDQTSLEGPSDPRFGSRPFSMIDSYDKDLLAMGLDIGQEIGINKFLHRGVYACLGGPAYETVAEERALRTMGVDAVGMSLLPEVIAARHGGLKIFSFVIISWAANDKPVEEADKDADPGSSRTEEKEPMEVSPLRVQACCDLIGRLLYDMHQER